MGLSTSGGTVLVLDDEPALLRMVCAYLQKIGYTVVPYASTDEAWQGAGSFLEQVDLAVIDGTMNGMSSIDLAGRLLQANERLRVILASGYPTSLEELELIAPGRSRFLQKPFTPEMLARTLREIAAQEASPQS